ncbi:MAG: hypothetical protein GOU99_03325 [Candidatus Altiarchaeota archaeon]|nr:hypothetical protein [Candidatus Altiarchaeota archaeon]
MNTTIQVHSKTKQKLENLKIYSREPFNSVIERLLASGIDTTPLSKQSLVNIQESLKDIEAGKVYSNKQIKKRLGL